MAEGAGGFSAFPAKVKYGFYCLVFGWLWNFFFLYKVFDRHIPEKILIQQMVICGILCYFVFKEKNWARVMTMVANLMLIVLHALIFLLFLKTRTELSAISAINIVAFSVSTFFFFSKEAATHYKSILKKDSKENTSEQKNASKKS